jgi:hypothetical protein
VERRVSDADDESWESMDVMDGGDESWESVDDGDESWGSSDVLVMGQDYPPVI